MSGKIKKYIGIYSYFATGEGFRVFVTNFEAKNKKDALHVFLKCYKNYDKPFPGFKGESLVFFRMGTTLFSVDVIPDVRMDKTPWEKMAQILVHDYLSSDIFKEAANLIREGTMLPGEFVFWYQYNRS